MKNLNFKKPLLGPDNKVVDGGQELNEFLSSMLMQSAEIANPVKYFDWAIKLFNEGNLLLDNSDVQLLTDFIKNHKQINVLGKGRLLEAFLSAEVEESK